MSNMDIAHAALDRAWANAMPHMKGLVPTVVLQEVEDKLDDYRIACEQEIALITALKDSAEEEAQAMAIVASEASEKIGACGRG